MGDGKNYKLILIKKTYHLKVEKENARIHDISKLINKIDKSNDNEKITVSSTK
jgi:hypothetical protein